MRTIFMSRPGRVSISLAAAAFGLVASALVIPSPAQAQAVFPGLAKCLQDCENDKECQADCRENFMNHDDRDQYYQNEFRKCFNECYPLSGKEREECIKPCREDYKIGNHLN